jgi:two-component system, LuxR family, response regulator FixJ
VQATAMKQGPELMMPLPVVTIVDDDPAVCSSLKFSLETEGFIVRAYGSADELLGAGNLGNCDCFVIDQRMSSMSGLELIAKLRAQEVLAPAILLVSSQPTAVLKARAKMAHVPIVEKPLFGDALVDRIREICRPS